MADKTLLERLNALKPSTVNLESSSTSIPASTIQPAKPASREDALTERLKSLREKSSEARPPPSPLPGKDADQERGDAASTPLTPQTSQPQRGGANHGAELDPVPAPGADDVDPLLLTDDQTLEELLADLGSDQPWLDEVAKEEEEHQRVMAMLDELGKASPQDGTAGEKGDGGGDDDSESDDSEGDDMVREADDVLAEAMDEVDWEHGAHETQSPTSPSRILSSSTQDQPGTPTQSTGAAKPKALDLGGDPFNLPGVPSTLHDQPDLPDSPEDADFAASIASRMAALKVNTPPPRTLPSAPTSEVDALGLPVPPSFAPEDRPVPGLVKRVGYTDEDQKTWCTVCLEDGTIRCLGCDGDVYCARCWKEMHVGPAAGYDERGHRWERFVKGR
ncbi:hypothetical protein F5Y15DRAFT_297397 [Xylariaceae sp. FL0016]|nr:hypothetical protein F5Y15DRAFT_297397 [Xylariaceae sp. FL0016]